MTAASVVHDVDWHPTPPATLEAATTCPRPSWSTAVEIDFEDEAVVYVGRYGEVDLSAALLFGTFAGASSARVSLRVGGYDFGDADPAGMRRLASDLCHAATALESPAPAANMRAATERAQPARRVRRHPDADDYFRIAVDGVVA